MKKDKIFYYSDELKDEFEGNGIKTIKIDENYNYGSNSIWWKIKHFFWYRIVYWPLAQLYLIFKWNHKIINKKVLKTVSKKQAFFLYGNHTNPVADAFVPTFTCKPKNTYVIVHPNNVSLPIIGQINKYVGALPLPDTLGASKNFMDIIKLRIEENSVIHIYPEAHVWPFYTKIRPFVDLSFRYPVQYKTPVFCFTNTYQKRKFSKTPRLVTYVDGPFYADQKLSTKEQRKQLRDMIYNTMCERAKNSNVELIKYIKK